MYRLESCFEIRHDIEDVVSRVHPTFNNDGTFDKFEGWASMNLNLFINIFYIKILFEIIKIIINFII